VRTDVVRRTIFTAARGVRNSLQTVADRLAVPIADESDHHEIHDIIENEINQILGDMDKEFAGVVAAPIDNEQQKDTDS
jgi:hypothetical protein